jgi:50S ribosomal protein L16 3-hydroxylase
VAAAQLQLDTEAFLARHWQQRHLFVPGALPGFRPPIDAGELAGLALESDIESRIIEQRGDRWLLQHGPFVESDFLRDGPWTLLVQAVDHCYPEVAALRRLVGFLPSWRVDDIMVSYATDGGGVGPHFDSYDVFLLQGSGRRTWRVGPFCDGDTPLLPHRELRILQRFDCEAEYELGPGDLLYVPPGVAHWGIARGECTTFSIGFRAPPVTEMVSRWVDQLLEELDPELYYRDLRPEPATRPGEIRPADLRRALAQLQGALDQAGDERWFGELVTEPRYAPEPDAQELADGLAALRGGAARVELSPAAKLAWQRTPEGVTVYANGASRQFPAGVADVVARLCGEWRLEGGALSDPGRCGLLQYLLENGCVYVE